MPLLCHNLYSVCLLHTCLHLFQEFHGSVYIHSKKFMASVKHLNAVVECFSPITFELPLQPNLQVLGPARSLTLNLKW